MQVALAERVLAYAPRAEEELWAEYLLTCRGASEGNYEEVEPWAWRRLQRKLGVLPKGKTKETR